MSKQVRLTQPLGEVIDSAGGVRGGRPLQAVLLGGAAGTASAYARPAR